MNLVQQRRDFLDFIEHDPRLRWAITHDGFESVWVAGQFQKQGGVKEVEAGRVSERLPQPGALARAPRAEQEEGTAGAGQVSGNDVAGVHEACIPRYRIIAMRMCNCVVKEGAVRGRTEVDRGFQPQRGGIAGAGADPQTVEAPRVP